MGPILGAEFLAVVTDLGGYQDASPLAACAGLAPVPRESGRKTGSRRRPRHYDRRLRRLFYLSAQTAMSRPAAPGTTTARNDRLVMQTAIAGPIRSGGGGRGKVGNPAASALRT